MPILLSASMAKSRESRTLASCPATMNNKSTPSAPTLSRDVGTAATFYTDDSQVVERYRHRERKGSYKQRKVSNSLD